MGWIVATAAGVQAVAAVWIWRLTRKLFLATNAYVIETQALALEARRTNDLAQQNTERALRRHAAIVEVELDGRGHNPESDEWTFQYRLTNVGQGTALGIVVGFQDVEVLHRVRSTPERVLRCQ